jgi:hypothetical protein
MIARLTSEVSMKDFAIQLTHRPGELARVADALARYGVNIKAVAGVAIDNRVVVRIIGDEPDSTRMALERNNIRFEEEEVVKVLLENRAGELASTCKKLAEAGVNLYAIYLTGIVDDLVELAVVTDNPKRARRVLE